MNKILHIVPYKQLYPPQNGGQLRCFHLVNQLARFYKVDVLCYQKQTEFDEKGFSNTNINFYSPDSFKFKSGLWSTLPNSIKNTIRYRWLRRSFGGPAEATVLDFAHVIINLAKDKTYDLVIYEHISSMRLSPLVKRVFPNVKTVIDAHNIDYKLISDIELRQNTRVIESNFYKNADSFWACSDQDVRELEVMNQNRIVGKIVPNGVDSKSKSFQENKEGLVKKLLFCGTLDYFPNKEGLLWFFDTIWPLVTEEINDVELTIIGRGDLSAFKHFNRDKRVCLIGEVEEVATYYKKNYISIVPLLSGSGTRLKILEAMSFGNPVVTTSIGIEGIKAVNGKEALIADTSEAFAKSIIKIIKEPSCGEELRQNALNLIKMNYDWNVIGNFLHKILTNE